jgi:hypothetical protein
MPNVFLSGLWLLRLRPGVYLTMGQHSAQGLPIGNPAHRGQGHQQAGPVISAVRPRASPRGIEKVNQPLSFRCVEDLLAKRGINIRHATVRLRWNRFGRMLAAFHNHFDQDRQLTGRDTTRPRCKPPAEWKSLAARALRLLL